MKWPQGEWGGGWDRIKRFHNSFSAPLTFFLAVETDSCESSGTATLCCIFFFPCTHFVLFFCSFIDVSGGEEMEESVEEETRSNRSIGISKEKTKKKKKIRKVMSWNF